MSDIIQQLDRSLEVATERNTRGAGEAGTLAPSEEQEATIAAVKAGGNILVTGGAGTGKSFLLKELVRRLDGRLPVTASTGIAAINVGGCTIHSYAGLGMGDEPLDTLIKKVLERKKVVQRLRQFNRLAIDEISMISRDLFDKLDGVLKAVRNNDLPFGGMQIVAIGDYLQLPPVYRGGMPEKPFAFQSKAWEAGKFRLANLTKVFRQEDRDFAKALAAVRLGFVDDEAGAIFRSRYRVEDPEPDKPCVEVLTTNVDVDAINLEKLMDLPGRQMEWTAQDIGEEWYLPTIAKNCLAPTVLKLRVGAQVMLLRNLDVESGLANGSVGTVVDLPIQADDGPTILFANGQKQKIERASWEIKVGTEIVAERRQFPLRLAWAITTHKSQGTSIDKIKVHLANVFEAGQAYVALSRARTLPGLFIESTAKGCVWANPDALKFYENAEMI